ncbi:DUF5776 domain-containing protein [Lentilactobacillus diolivorans]|uniref:DUF5776 domain-containing protein n=2 Tax=Lentilactobacillus diolivorans TaxID=179838 RepID=A0A0R1S1D7_9LACO|nr:DUF5776 domain-containing protein [Lentilactobacillus diolivorans]KRL62876.1 hypothetical protein FC85_GL001744 [Lentilactobacillus diolivorans DSM 14421]GEP23464.1 hypothetical protein LDI01_10570 [Lentilactobacillus diolivorans]
MHNLFLTSGDQKSNYAQSSDQNTTPGVTTPADPTTQPMANSIIDVDQFGQNSSNLVEHYNLTNTATDASKFVTTNRNMYLPIHWNKQQVVKDSPNVVAGGMPTIDISGVNDFDLTHYVKPFTAILYHFTNGDSVSYTDSDKLKTEDPSKLEFINFENSVLWPQETLSISVPLKVDNLDKVNTNNANGTFTIGSESIANPTGSANNLSVRFAKKLSQAEIDKHFNVGKKYLVATRNKDYEYTQATDIQNLMPNIRSVGDPNELTIDNLNTGESDKTYYSGAFFYLDPEKMDKATNGQTVLEMLNSNGYVMANGLTRFKWGSVYNPNDPGHQYPNDALSKLNTGDIGNVVFQPVQVIDANAMPTTLDYGAKFDPNDYIKINDPASWYQVDNPYTVAEAKEHGLNVTVASNVDTKNPGSKTVKITLPITQGGKTINVTKTINVLVKQPGSTSGNTGSTGSSTTSTGTTGSSTTSNNSGNTSGSTSTSSTPTTTTNPSTLVGPNIAVKGEAVYATKKIGLYKNANFKKSQRVAWYPKQKRVNRPMFVVTGYKRAANGALRYRVRDVNHARKTAGKIGYITVSRKYVVPVYYASVPKSKKITVISKKGVNAYKSANLTGKAKHYKKGVRLTVKKLVKHNLTTRYQLSNGKYITANKKLIIAGNY